MNYAAPLNQSIPDGTILVDAYREPRRVPLFEQAILIVWFVVTYITVPMQTPLRYAMLALILCAGLFHYRIVGPVLLKAWPLLLLPIYGAFSFMWSDYPSAAMRSGLLYLLTPVIAIIIIARVDLRTILRCLFFASAFAVIWSLQWQYAFAWGGPYGSKNYLAHHMNFAMFFAILRLFDKDEWVPIRIVAMPIIALACWIMLQAHSATALIFAIVGVSGLLMVRFFWLYVGRLKHLRSIILMMVALLSLTTIMVILSLPTNTIIADFLGMLGKDATLTGRADIWRVGELVVQEDPIFGKGLEGFWQYDVGTAQTINENDHKPVGTKLTFHNAYMEVQVHLGIVGWVMFVGLVGWCVWMVVIDWLRRPSLETSAMLVIAAIIYTSTFTESSLWTPFNAFTNLFYFAALAPLSAERRRYLGKIRARVHSAGSDR